MAGYCEDYVIYDERRGVDIVFLVGFLLPLTMK